MKNNPQIYLLPYREKPILAGHPWVFSKAVDYPKSDRPENGAIVDLYSNSGEFLATAFWNSKNSICLRVISKDKIEKLDKKYFIKRFKELHDLKLEFLPKDTNAFRLCYADSDWLPGLIVDIYDKIIVFQIHIFGMERYRDEIISALNEAFTPDAIVERSDINSRKAEGLFPLPAEIHYGKISDTTTFKECGLIFIFDPLHGQKTGFFLDQRDARIFTGKLSKGKNVLNLFSYTGAFGLYAAKNGAKKVTCVDISKDALSIAKEIFELNSLSAKCEFIEADIFDWINYGTIKKGQYNLVICDPPALAKSNSRVDNAIKAYTSLNKSCVELLDRSGLLVTSSCSGRLTHEDFREVLKISAGRAMKDMRVLSTLGQSFDHTDRISFPEGRYLKTLVMEVL